MTRAGARLVALVLAVTLAGCALIPTPWVGAWRLRSVGGNPAAAPATIVLTATDVVLQTGCNTGAGSYVVDGGRLTLKDVAFTLMLCADALGRQDTAFALLTSGSPSISVSGDTLTIDPGAGGSVLVFDRTSGA